MKLTQVAVSQDEDLKLRTQNRDRDDTQVELDKIVAALAATWKGMAENPSTVPPASRPRDRVAVAPDDRTEAKSRLRRAATAAKVGVAFFEDAEVTQGRAVITFTVTAPPAKKH